MTNLESFTEIFDCQTGFSSFSGSQESFNNAFSMLGARTTPPPDQMSPSDQEFSSFSSWSRTDQLVAPSQQPCENGFHLADHQRELQGNSASFAAQASNGYGAMSGTSFIPALPSLQAFSGAPMSHQYSYSFNPSDKSSSTSPPGVSSSSWSSYSPTHSHAYSKAPFPQYPPTSRRWDPSGLCGAAFGGSPAREATKREGDTPNLGRRFTGALSGDHRSGDAHSASKPSPQYRMISPPLAYYPDAALPRISAAPSSLDVMHKEYPCQHRMPVAPIVIPVAPPMLPTRSTSRLTARAEPLSQPGPEQNFGGLSCSLSREALASALSSSRCNVARSTPSSSASSSPTSATFSSPTTSMSGSAQTAERKAQRKARRDVTQALNVGFVPTNPESLSSHEKKRYYLESLEQYVMYLHEQLKLVASEPVPLERVSTYRGLSSRSIRTLLVHMRNGVGKLALRTEHEEQKFITRRDAVYSQALEPSALHDYERHFGSATASNVTQIGEALGSSLGSLGTTAAKEESWTLSKNGTTGIEGCVAPMDGKEDAPGAVSLGHPDDASDAVGEGDDAGEN
ncbi:hypothetical protein BD626DRAFT_566782 [Schizophyllum amplum]|uniref:Uncharacterized protein n=1 Tax=Schizophyllum amplum TaxID=97359 RepID=A0A550CMY1_9AGAR|nr:hypothetical protein BD626DRAFT_566782 [Auriculariopsis ampla]